MITSHRDTQTNEANKKLRALERYVLSHASNLVGEETLLGLRKKCIPHSNEENRRQRAKQMH
eukprot:4195384-Amphidinium_carterae.1